MIRTFLLSAGAAALIFTVTSAIEATPADAKGLAKHDRAAVAGATARDGWRGHWAAKKERKRAWWHAKKARKGWGARAEARLETAPPRRYRAPAK